MQIYNWLSSRRAITADERRRLEFRGITRDPSAAECLTEAVTDFSAVSATDIESSFVPLLCRTLEECLSTLDKSHVTAMYMNLAPDQNKIWASNVNIQHCFQNAPNARVPARRTEGSVDVACMHLRLWCNAYHQALLLRPATTPSQSSVTQHFTRLAVRSTGTRWERDAGAVPRAHGREIINPGLTRLLANASGVDPTLLSEEQLWGIDAQLVPHNSFVRCKGRVFRPCAAISEQHALARVHLAAHKFCEYTEMRSLKREQEALLLDARATVDVSVDHNDLCYDSEDSADNTHDVATLDGSDSSSDGDTSDDGTSGSSSDDSEAGGAGHADPIQQPADADEFAVTCEARLKQCYARKTTGASFRGLQEMMQIIERRAGQEPPPAQDA